MSENFCKKKKKKVLDESPKKRPAERWGDRRRSAHSLGEGGGVEGRSASKVASLGKNTKREIDSKLFTHALLRKRCLLNKGRKKGSFRCPRGRWLDEGSIKCLLKKRRKKTERGKKGKL